MAFGSRNPRMNFRGSTDNTRNDTVKGTKPTPQPTSVKEVMLMMVIHVCKKSIFFDTNIKVALYLGALFLVSLIADFASFPKSYFSHSSNVFNQYFVKIGWFWTLILTVPFTFMVSNVHCCGRRDRVLKGHLTRLAIATVFWYGWTMFFNYIETSFGRCNAKIYTTKSSCLKNGHFWSGFDISGHCFILIYSSLVLIEEAKGIIGWEGIRDYIRDEQYSRSINERMVTSNPLRALPKDELDFINDLYPKYTPYVRGLFIAMSALQVLWDVMLFCTLIYYHVMVEKFVSGVIAVLTWYVTYRAWYRMPKFFPNLPGDGIYKYNREKTATSVPLAAKRRNSLIINGKHFMGNPLYGSRPQESGDSTIEDNIVK